VGHYYKHVLINKLYCFRTRIFRTNMLKWCIIQDVSVHSLLKS